MIFSRAIVLAVAFRLALSQDCPPGSGDCDFTPFNPVICGADKACGYDNFCLASGAGFDVEADCCQAPQPSACIQSFAPVVCGDKACPYDNTCLAELAGYSADQCTDAPEECPAEEGNCAGEPANPVKCGAGKQCKYENFCLARANGYDVEADCCQDTRQNTACGSIFAPVSCGPPAGKQCPYGSQCEADAAGYNDKQCCNAVPEGNACTSEVTPPVECGSIPCLYTSQCEASAAGYSESECCPQAQGVCTAENDPYACGANKCQYSSLSCANAAGWTSDECCKQPADVGTCSGEYAPLTCSQAGCIYDNACIAELAGFDPNSCVKVQNTQNTGATSGAVGTKPIGAGIGAILVASFRALF